MKDKRITPEPTILKDILPLWWRATFNPQPKQSNEQPKK